MEEGPVLHQSCPSCETLLRNPEAFCPCPRFPGGGKVHSASVGGDLTQTELLQSLTDADPLKHSGLNSALYTTIQLGKKKVLPVLASSQINSGSEMPMSVDVSNQTTQYSFVYVLDVLMHPFFYTSAA